MHKESGGNLRTGLYYIGKYRYYVVTLKNVDATCLPAW